MPRTKEWQTGKNINAFNLFCRTKRLVVQIFSAHFSEDRFENVESSPEDQKYGATLSHVVTRASEPSEYNHRGYSRLISAIIKRILAGGSGGIAMRKIEFVSQRGKRWENEACGVASLMMLLKYRRPSGQVPSYEDLGRQLRVSESPQTKGYRWYPKDSGPAAWIDDITSWLSRNKIPHSSIYGDYWLQKDPERPTETTAKIVLAMLKDGPVMVGVAGHGFDTGGHWIVLGNFSKGELEYLDPWLKKEKKGKLNWERFLKAWDGTAVALRS